MDVKQRLVVLVLATLFLYAGTVVVLHDTIAHELGFQVGGVAPSVVRPVSLDTRPAELNFSMKNGQIVLDGMLPSSNAQNSLLGRAADLYGQDQFVDQLSVSQDIETPVWIEHPELFLPSRFSMGRGSSVSVIGSKVTLNIRFRDEETRRRYLGDLNTAFGLSALDIKDASTAETSVAERDPRKL